MLQDWNFWLSLSTWIVALVALFISIYQMGLSNKQSLFEKRLKCYNIVSGILRLCEENQRMINEKRADDPWLALDLEMTFLTNNTFLEELADAYHNPLQQPYHKTFLKKREELECIGEEVSLIFSGKTGITFRDFILAFDLVLQRAYQYVIVLDKMEKHNEENPSSIEEKQRIFPEQENREYLQQAFKELQANYEIIIKGQYIRKLQRQLRLTGKIIK